MISDDFLRDYQIECRDSCLESLNNNRSTLAVMATGTGKTVTGLSFAAARTGGTVLWLAHREELVTQPHAMWRDLYDDFGDIVQQKQTRVGNRFKSRITFASVQTLYRPDRLRSEFPDPREVSTLIVDECFVAGTLVDGVPIESVNKGDYVSAFDHRSRSVQKRKVLDVWKKPYSGRLVRFWIGEESTTMTPNHPVWNNDLRRYVRADSLASGDSVVVATTKNKTSKEFNVYEKGFSSDAMLCLREEFSAGRGSETKKTRSLLERVPQHGEFSNNVEDEFQICFREDEVQQPDEPRGCSDEGFYEAEGYWMEASSSGREWSRHDGPRETSGVCSWLERDRDTNRDAERFWIPDLLQSGCRELSIKDRDRSGRPQPSGEREETPRQEEAGFSGVERLDRVEVLELGHREESGGMRPEGFVYNLHVEGLNNYFANGILVHNCHHHTAAGQITYDNIVNYFMEGNPDCRKLGLTATPDRGDEISLSKAFESVAFDYPLYSPNGAPCAVSDGWLVPVEQETVFIEDLQLDSVGTKGGDFIDSQLEQEMLKEKPLHRITEATWDITKGKSTIVFTAGVEQSVRMSEIFCRKRESSSYAIVSRIPDDGKEYPWCILSSDKDRRRRLFDSFRKGEFPLLCNCLVATEGFDAPITQFISMGRPTKSRALFAQKAGRGTRVLPNVIEGKNLEGGWWRLGTAEERRAAIEKSDKKSMTIIDFVGNTRHSLVSAIDILGGTMPDEVVARANENAKDGKAPKNAIEALEQAEEELEAERQKREMARLALDADKRKLIEAKVAYTRQKVDVFHVLHVHAIREPEWHRNRKPTQRMIDALGNMGVKPEEMSKMSFVTAAACLDRIGQRRKDKLCTLKQAKVLAKSGIDPDRISFTHASALIARLANNKWKPLAPSDVLGIIGQK